MARRQWGHANTPPPRAFALVIRGGHSHPAASTTRLKQAGPRSRRRRHRRISPPNRRPRARTARSSPLSDGRRSLSRGRHSTRARWWMERGRAKSEEKRRRDRHPPRAKTHTPRTAHDLLDCGSENHRGDSRAATCRRCCAAPCLHAEPPTRKRSWDLAARPARPARSARIPSDSHWRRPRQPARVLAPTRGELPLKTLELMYESP